MQEIPLPDPGPSNVADHVAMSRRFLAHAAVEMSRGNRLQASEKVWGAAAHALKAVGEHRGWIHHGHYNLNAINRHLIKEFNRPDFRAHMNSANAMHINFYENFAEEPDIQAAIDDVEQFIAKLDAVRSSPPRPFTISTEAEQRALRWLTGKEFGINSHSEVGFSQTHQENGGEPNTAD